MPLAKLQAVMVLEFPDRSFSRMEQSCITADMNERIDRGALEGWAGFREMGPRIGTGWSAMTANRV